MSQFQTPTPRRASGGPDVYTGLLFAAFVVLVAGVALLAVRNVDHSDLNGRGEGGMVGKLID